MVKSPTWQLARVYIYTLPFANLDMILENCLFAWVCGCFEKIDDFCQLPIEISSNSEVPNL
jgi:hypothetical protein